MRLQLLIGFTILLCSCSQGGGGTPGANGGDSSTDNVPQQRPSGTLHGKAVDALIVGGTLSVYSWDGGVKGGLLGSAITENDGGYSLAIQTPSKPVLLELVGGHYAEEASGKRIDLSARHKLRAIAYYESGTDLTVMVTPWTNVAVAFAEHQMRTAGLNANNAITSSASALAAIVDVDIYNTVPWDVTQESTDTIFTDELKYGLTLAAASSLTVWASEENELETHATFNSINFAEMMYLDVLADGVLNGNGYRITADGSLSEQVVAYSLGVVPVNVELYRRQLALEMLKVVSADYNKTQMTINDVFSNADRFSTSTHMLWSPEAPIHIDIDGPLISSNLTAGQVYGGEITLPISVSDLLSISRVDYYLDDEFLETRSNPTSTDIILDTSEYSDGDHVMSVYAWDSLVNKGSTTIPLRFDNSGPTLTVVDDLLTNKDTFVLTGTAVDPTKSGLVVTVNDQPASMFDGGKWRIEVSLSSNITPVTVVASDGLGNYTEEVVTIALDKTEPEVEPFFSNARFYDAEVGGIIKRLNQGGGAPVYFDLASLVLGGTDVSESTLENSGIPYIGIKVSDSGVVLTSFENLIVRYQALKNDVPLFNWRVLTVTSIDEESANYIIPLVTEFMSSSWVNSKVDDTISIHFLTEDQAGNSSDFKFNFNAYIDFPKLHINTQYIRTDITAYEFLSDGNLGGIIGECTTDDIGYCQIAVAGDVSDIQIRAEGGEYTEPATGDKTDVDLVKSYIQYSGADLVAYIHPLSAIYSAMVEREKSISDGVALFNQVYGFHPYATKSEKLTSISTLTDGVKLGLQLRGISEFATASSGTSDEFTSLMATDYTSDGLLDGVAILQVEPEVLQFGGKPVTTNTYRTDIAYAALLAVSDRSVVYDYLNEQSLSSSAVYGEKTPVALDVEGPSIQASVPMAWANAVNITYQITDISNIATVTLSIDNLPYATGNLGAFSVNSLELADGAHSVSIHAEDSIGNASEYKISVVVDNTGPEVLLNAPAVAAASVKIAVSATDLVEMLPPVLLIDGDPAGDRAVLTESIFTVNTKNMEDGVHVFSVQVLDALGNIGLSEVSIRIDNTKPELVITSPILVNELDYIVTGTVNDATTVTVTVNGKSAEITDGVWHYPVRLSALQTIFDVEASDAVSNVTVGSVKVDYDAYAPEIQWLTSSGEYINEFGSRYKVNSIFNDHSDHLVIPVDLISIGDTEWNSTEIDLSGYIYIEPIITDTENPGSTKSSEILVETRYLEDDVVKRDWEKWTRTSRTIPFVTETLAPGWEDAGDDVVRKIQVRATDKAGNTSEPETWEFKVHIVRDFIAPFIVPERTLNRFTKSDGLLNNCGAGDLTPVNSATTPICLDSEKVSLQGKSIDPSLSNEGFSAVEVEVSDPFGEGFYTNVEDLVVEYQYLKDDQMVMDWTLAPRQENDAKSIYLPLVTETLGDQFFISARDTAHKLLFRVTDKEGNQSLMNFDLKMDVLTKEFDVIQPVAANDEIFNIDFNNRSTLNGNSIDIAYDFKNETDIPYLIGFESISENQVTQTWESAQRFNRARVVEQEEWRVKYCMNCSRGGQSPDKTSIKWSDWIVVDELWSWTNWDNKTRFTPINRTPEFTAVETNNVAGLSETQWSEYLPDGLCINESVADARLMPTDNSNYACALMTLDQDNGEMKAERNIQHRFVYSVEYDEGFPKNVITSTQNVVEFNNTSFVVMNDSLKKVINPVDGWYQIPPKTSVHVIKTTVLPSVINKDDHRVEVNDETVPYGSSISMDKSLIYDINTDLILRRSIDAGPYQTVSVSEQTIGDGIKNYSIAR